MCVAGIIWILYCSQSFSRASCFLKKKCLSAVIKVRRRKLTKKGERIFLKDKLEKIIITAQKNRRSFKTSENNNDYESIILWKK